MALSGVAQHRQRANSSLTDTAVHDSRLFYPASSPMQTAVGAVRSPSTFNELVRSLVMDKYNREYKLDQKTRHKAIEILSDFFAKREDQANVSSSAPALTRSLNYLNSS